MSGSDVSKQRWSLSRKRSLSTGEIAQTLEQLSNMETSRPRQRSWCNGNAAWPAEPYRSKRDKPLDDNDSGLGESPLEHKHGMDDPPGCVPADCSGLTAVKRVPDHRG